MITAGLLLGVRPLDVRPLNSATDAHDSTASSTDNTALSWWWGAMANPLMRVGEQLPQTTAEAVE